MPIHGGAYLDCRSQTCGGEQVLGGSQLPRYARPSPSRPPLEPVEAVSVTSFEPTSEPLDMWLPPLGSSVMPGAIPSSIC